MTLQELLSAGRLSEAIGAQNATLRARPTDLDARWRLAVLLCFAGDLDRASLQLDTLTAQNAEFGMGCAVYRMLLVGEAERRAVHGREGRPLLPPGAPAHAEARLMALEALRRADAAAARAALERAEAERPLLEGKLDGESFDDLADYDDLLGPILEVYAGGHYLWMPLELVKRLELVEPVQLADLLWPRAVLEDVSGAEAHVHLPALYFGSHEASDERLRLGRMTEWVEQSGLIYRGLGQKILLAERGGEARETALLQLRLLEIASVGAPRGG